MRNAAILSIFTFVLLAFGCGPDQRIIDSAKQKEAERESTIANSNIAGAKSDLETDLDAMRTADFKFILVFRRKDGQPLDGDDKALIGRNTGMQANRRRLTDGGKAVIIAGNFPFAAEPMKELTSRFNMDNQSKPDSGPYVSDEVPFR
jgi:hypothetical protein